MTLLEAMTDWMKFQARKHELGEPEEYAERLINEMSQYEFLVALSEALETITSADAELPQQEA